MSRPAASPDESGVYDLLIVGGGINGCGIARDAAGRGLKVLLVEQDDLAAHTSSASTKLIHGGLRYLELGDLRLVRESLKERERLLAIAPHIARPMRFVIPHAGSPRPGWLVRLGLLLYDYLGGRKRLPGTATVDLAVTPFGSGLREPRGKAFVYSDCWVDDSRLVVLNALDAAERGAEIRTRTPLVSAHRDGSVWHARVGDQQVRARALVNAAGPWVHALFERLDGARPRRGVRLVKGSHIVLPRLFEGNHAVLIQNPDRRIVFAVPYEGEFTLVGTTDRWWQGPPGAARIDEEETAYLLAAVRRTFARPVSEADVRWTYSGIRPLYDDGASSASTITRDYLLDLDTEGAPLLSIYGGKITTYRRLAEQALERLASCFPEIGCGWTARTPLPGGEGEAGTDLYQRYPALPSSLLGRLARSYGSRAPQLLGSAQRLTDLGECFGGDLTRREVDYLVDIEWARTGEDVLFRRSKLGLHLEPAGAARVQGYVEARLRTLPTERTHHAA